MTEWNVERAKDEIANGGRYGAKRVMEAVYRNNIDVFRHWGYRLPDGRLVGLGDRKALLVGTKVYAKPFDVNDVPVQAEPTASRRRPGGGYDRGMSAQEETLCRLSTLSQSLYQYYDPKYKCVQDAEVPHRFNAYPLDIDFGGIYSPGVMFFRKNLKDGYAFREVPFACGVITVAALSFREPNNYCNEERQYMAGDGGFTPEGDAMHRREERARQRRPRRVWLRREQVAVRCGGGPVPPRPRRAGVQGQVPRGRLRDSRGARQRTPPNRGEGQVRAVLRDFRQMDESSVKGQT